MQQAQARSPLQQPRDRVYATAAAAQPCRSRRWPLAAFASKQQLGISGVHTATQLQSPAQGQRHPAATDGGPYASAVLLSLPFIWADSAVAATVCIDVPDWLVDWRSALFHSPVVAVGVAGLALVLFPKLIRTAINYLAIPAILAMLAYAAVSFPEQTANSIYTVLEFIKEHPTASSIGIVVGAGALLGPDLLAGAAVAGLLVLLAVQLGILQMPQLPSLPKLPGQAMLSRQLNTAGRALREKLDDLDDPFESDEGSRGGSGKYSARAEALSAPSSSTAKLWQLESPGSLAPATGLAGRDTGQLPAASAAVADPQLQQRPEPAAAPAAAGLKGLAQELGSKAKALGSSALEQGKAVGAAVVQRGKEVQESGTVQNIAQQSGEAASRAAEGAKEAVAGLWGKGKLLQGSEATQALKQDASAVVGRARDKLKGLGAPAQQQAAATKELESPPSGLAAADIGAKQAVSSSDGTGADGGASTKNLPDIDSILSNS